MTYYNDERQIMTLQSIQFRVLNNLFFQERKVKTSSIFSRDSNENIEFRTFSQMSRPVYEQSFNNVNHRS